MEETSTPAMSEPNGRPPNSMEEQSPVASPHPADAGDAEKLPLTPEGWEYLADRKWVHEQYNLGRWGQYIGNYIAVCRKQLLGTGLNPLTLRERVATEHQLPPDRVVITYIDPGIDI